MDAISSHKDRAVAPLTGIWGNAAIERSMGLMKNHKACLFLLDLSLIGRLIHSVYTFGIILFLSPYSLTAHAHFYEDMIADERCCCTE